MSKSLARIMIGVFTLMLIASSAPAQGEVNAEQKIEQQQTAAEELAERKKYEAIFAKDYVVQTRVYRMKNINVSTAFDVARGELEDYHLMKYTMVKDGANRAGRQTVNRFIIIAGREIGRIKGDIPGGWFQEGGNSPVMSVEENAIPDERNDFLIVKAIPQTHQKIAQVLAEMEALVATEAQKDPGRQYRLQVALLRGLKVGESAAADPGANPLPFRVEGFVSEILVKLGENVKKGQVLIRLGHDEHDLDINKQVNEIQAAEAQLALDQDELKRTKMLVENGTTQASALRRAEVGYASSQAYHEQLRLELAFLESQLEHYVLKAPDDGVIANIMAQVNGHVFSDEPVIVLIPEKQQLAGEQAQSSSDLAKQYGISAADLKLFGIASLVEVGKGVVSIVLDDLDTQGSTFVTLTEDYGCHLVLLDERAPFVIAQCSLRGAKSGKTLLDNTLYLRPGESNVLGLTNMRQTLILVLRILEK